MDDWLKPEKLKEDAIYLGVLTARGIKPLSRLEYPVGPDVLDLLQGLGLTIAPLTRIAQNGARVTHLVLGTDSDLIEQYKADFDGSIILGQTPATVRLEARYFGFPACCAEAFVREPYALNDLAPQEQALLFHHACPGCQKTPELLPLYRSALARARQLNSSCQHTSQTPSSPNLKITSTPLPKSPGLISRPAKLWYNDGRSSDGFHTPTGLPR